MKTLSPKCKLCIHPHLSSRSGYQQIPVLDPDASPGCVETRWGGRVQGYVAVSWKLQSGTDVT